MSALKPCDFFRDSVTHEPLFTAVTLVSCGHNFNASTVDDIRQSAFSECAPPECPICGTNILHDVVNIDIRQSVRILFGEKKEDASSEKMLEDKLTHQPLFEAETLNPCGHNLNADTIANIRQLALKRRQKPACPICTTRIHETVANNAIRRYVLETIFGANATFPGSFDVKCSVEETDTVTVEEVRRNCMKELKTNIYESIVRYNAQIRSLPVSIQPEEEFVEAEESLRCNVPPRIGEICEKMFEEVEIEAYSRRYERELREQERMPFKNLRRLVMIYRNSVRGTR